MTDEFKEIGHSGGTISFEFIETDSGQYRLEITFRHSRPVAHALIGVYFLEGIAVGILPILGLGASTDPPPFTGCIPVYIASDTTGHFGHNCPRCKGYWRSGPSPHVCPYCRFEDNSYEFLSEAQYRYADDYCRLFVEAQSSETSSVTIDMDAVADAVGIDAPKPPFYTSEKRQQNKFTCLYCDEFNDVLGRFAYCSRCGTRNDFSIFQQQIVPEIRDNLNAGAVPERSLRDAVSSFDSFIAQYAYQLVQNVPMTEGRKHRLSKQGFHNLEAVQTTFKDWFDIDPCKGMREEERNFAARMFYRRHVYEHNGGEVNQKYLDDSGDSSVVLKQHIHEAKEDIHKLLSSLVTMAKNVHSGFHELIRPVSEPT
jgi:hypothetical protein